ncbi:MAG: hypoxanthine phosphoribosyltransferase [Nitrospiria bacterium]
MITQEAIRRRIKALGLRISKDYEHKNLLMIGVLKGAFAFFSDLSRAVKIPLHVDFLLVSRHRDKRRKDGGAVRIISGLPTNLQGYDVLIVEDIVDSGYTLTLLEKEILAQGPRTLHFCTLLDKPERRKVSVSARYVGFSIPDKYVVGYGLDHRNNYRNLPYIAVLDKIIQE